MTVSTPRRIRLLRTAGWRKPENTIVVARPSRWGNPFVVGEDVTINTHTEMATIELTPEMAVACYRDLMIGRLIRNPADHSEDAAYVQSWYDGLDQLRGHHLACWCPPDQPCHADVLLELANTEGPN